MIFLSNFIQKIIDFLFSLVTTSSDDLKNQKALKLLAAEVKKAKYPIFRPASTILAGLPIIIYELHRDIFPLYSILKTTIASSDVRISASVMDKIVERAFSQEQKDMRENLSMEKRCEKIDDFLTDDFDSKIKEQNKIFNDLLFCLTEPKFKRVDLTVDKLYSFFDLCEFKFNAFFAHFDSEFEVLAGTNTVRDHYNFQNIEGQEVLQEILDLDYLIRNVTVDEDFSSGLLFVNSQMPEKLRRNESLIKRDLQNFLFITENNLGVNTLRNLAKLIKKNPLFEDAVKPKAGFSVTEEYKRRISAMFNADTKKILKMQQEAQMAHLIENLFGAMEMQTVSVYNEELNKRIQSVSHLSLDWIKPLEIINFQKDLAADYYFCSSILSKLTEFEELMNGKNENSIEAIKGYVMRLENGGDFEKNLSKIIDAVNVKVSAIIRETGKHYFDLFKASMLVAKDAHKAIPEYVNNLKAMIISTRNKERFTAFEESMPSFEAFIDILKHYVIFDVPGIN